MQELCFALFFGNRGFFPETLIAGARKEINDTVKRLGYKTLIMEEGAITYGAVESMEEGRKSAAFLKQHEDEYDGVIMSLPNFGDENGAIAALQDYGVPILIQAYPDETGKIDFLHKRDAFCGKFSIMDVFYQYNLPFTVYEPHVINPLNEEYEFQINDFAAVCRIVKKMKRSSAGTIGERTIAFKTVRFDEITILVYGITTETLDLSELFMRVKDVKVGTEKFKQKREHLLGYANWTIVAG